MVQHWDLVHNMTTLYKNPGRGSQDSARSTKPRFVPEHGMSATHKEGNAWTSLDRFWSTGDRSVLLYWTKEGKHNKPLLLSSKKLVNDRTTTSFSKHCKLSIREWSREGRRGRPLWSAILSVSVSLWWKLIGGGTKRMGPKEKDDSPLMNLDWIGLDLFSHFKAREYKQLRMALNQTKRASVSTYNVFTVAFLHIIYMYTHRQQRTHTRMKNEINTN